MIYNAKLKTTKIVGITLYILLLLLFIIIKGMFSTKKKKQKIKANEGQKEH